MTRTISIKLIEKTRKEVAVTYFGIIPKNLRVVLKIFTKTSTKIAVPPGDIQDIYNTYDTYDMYYI
jgi:hypothetical protein